MRQISQTFVTAAFTLGLAAFSLTAEAALEGPIPTKGMPTVASFGSDGCGPCKLMLPVLEKLDKEFEGRVAIRYLNLTDYPELAGYFKIASVPTQIFYDHTGKEIGWHTGFIDEGSIREAIDGMLAEQKKSEKKAK